MQSNLPDLQLKQIQRYVENQVEKTLYMDVLVLAYHPLMPNKPDDLCATLAQSMAAHLIIQTQSLPADNQAYFNEASEVVASTFGFGLMLSNSAYTFRGGCGRCFQPQANRVASLNESEQLFLLALFCFLKQIPFNSFKRYLKPHLRSAYRQGFKQVQQLAQDSEVMQRLQAAST